MQHGQAQRQSGRRIKIELGPQTQLLPAIGVVPIERGIVPKSVGPILVRRQAPPGRCSQRAANSHAQRPHVVISEGKFRFGLRFERRLTRACIDQSGQSIGAVACALRAPQYFDTAKIKAGCDPADSRKIDVVQQKTHRRIGRTLILRALADSPHLEVARPRRSAGPMKVRRNLRQLLEVLHRALPNRFGIKHRNAGGQVQAANLLERSRYHQLFEHSAGLLLVGRLLGLGLVLLSLCRECTVDWEGGFSGPSRQGLHHRPKRDCCK